MLCLLSSALRPLARSVLTPRMWWRSLGCGCTSRTRLLPELRLGTVASGLWRCICWWLCLSPDAALKSLSQCPYFTVHSCLRGHLHLGCCACSTHSSLCSERQSLRLKAALRLYWHKHNRSFLKGTRKVSIAPTRDERREMQGARVGSRHSFPWKIYRAVLWLFFNIFVYPFCS